MAGKRLALIIASSQYEDAGLQRLHAPAQDAGALARVLSDPSIGRFDVQTLLNEPSYRVNQAIDSFFTDRERDDFLALYFSCHGIKSEQGRLYYATPDTQRKLLRSTAISASFVNEVMNTSRSRQQVLILDCCYSGAFARGMLARSDKGINTSTQFEGTGRVVLTASDAMEYSFEGDEIQAQGNEILSVFTSALMHGLETGEADLDGDGQISLDELYDYVRERVRANTPHQNPGRWYFDLHGNIIVAMSPRPTRPAELPQDLQMALGSVFVVVREQAAVPELDRLLRGSHRGVSFAAMQALQDLRDNDDSLRVRAAAEKVLAAYVGTDAEVTHTQFQSQQKEPQPPRDPGRTRILNAQTRVLNILCPVCRTSVSSNDEFCDWCGAALLDLRDARTRVLGVWCPDCGTHNPSGAEFCDGCGASLLGIVTASSTVEVIPQSDLVGTTLAGQYRVLRKIAQGGFSAVYLAEDMKVASRHCVIKGAISDDPEYLEMVRQGSQTLSILNHSSLPKVYNTLTERGKWYSVTELIEGQTLLEKLEADSITETDVIDFAIQICDLLNYLHTRQPPVIVRDIKPANFIVRYNDARVVLIDLSIGRQHKSNQAKDTQAWGTDGYAPPEQYGQGQTDARSDLFGLGATLHHLLTGRDPSRQPLFSFPPVTKLKPNLNLKWNNIVAKATQLDSSKRYQSAEEMKKDITQLFKDNRELKLDKESPFWRRGPFRV